MYFWKINFFPPYASIHIGVNDKWKANNFTHIAIAYFIVNRIERA